MSNHDGLKGGTPVLCLVANSATARVFRSPGGRGKLSEVEQHDHPEGRMHPRDLMEDRPGRVHERTTTGRSATDGVAGALDELDAQFARRLCDRLRELGRETGIRRTWLVAAPDFLGQLRKAASSRLDGMTIESIDKDLTGFDPEGIRERLPELL